MKKMKVYPLAIRCKAKNRKGRWVTKNDVLYFETKKARSELVRILEIKGCEYAIGETISI